MKATKEHKPKNNRNYMSDEAFAELKGAMEDALAFQRGDHRELVVTRIPTASSPTPVSTKKISRTIKRHS
jgi:hypothetical protein